MGIKKLEDGKYQLDIYPMGKAGKRIRRKFSTRRECKLFEAEIIKEYQSTPSKFEKDTRTLIDLVDLWFKYHGHSLKDAKYRYSRTKAICERLGNPMVYQFNADSFSNYRKNRLDNVSIATINHETRYLRSVFNELERIGYFYGLNPLKGIRTFREKERELTFLTQLQIDELLHACAQSSNTHCLPVVKLCLSTGARWSEANEIKAMNLREDRVIYSDTKNGKSRVIPIKPELSRYLRQEGFKTSHGRLFDSARGAFRKAIDKTSIKLPEGQLTHVLRHTYASHFIMNGGNILTLQKILGHSDLKVTMRYAHLAPDYMNEAISCSPLR